MKTADETHFCVRRLPPWSHHWKESEKRPTTLAFTDKDKGGKLSVDLFLSPFNEEEAIEHNKDYVHEKGFGLALARVGAINTKLFEKEILENNSRISGRVYEDPIPRVNERHAIVSGEDTKKKQKVLRELFTVFRDAKMF